MEVIDGGNGTRRVKRDDWQDRILRTSGGNPQPISNNVKILLQHDRRLQGIARYCEFSQRVTRGSAAPWNDTATVPWEKRDTLLLRQWLADHWQFEPSKDAAMDGVLGAAYEDAYHPIRDWLHSLEWDGNPRLSTWLYRYLGADDGNSWHRMAYLRSVGCYWMMAAIARAMEPGCKFDYVLILEGAQGSYKSTSLRTLANPWFTDGHVDLNSKDGNQFVQGCWVIELAELDSLNKVEATRAKAFFGQQSDRFRPPFGAQVEEFPRQCVFAGTTNQSHYLKDPTGGRRFWPIRCGRIDIPGLERDRDQLWAEAFLAWRARKRFAPRYRSCPTFEREQDARYSADGWQELIEEFLATTTKQAVTTGDIFIDGLQMTARDMKPPEQVRIGLIMARITDDQGRSWQKRKIRIADGKGGSRRVWAYCRPGGKHDLA